MTWPINVVFLNSTQHPLSLHVYGQLTEVGSIEPFDSQVVFILHLRWYFRRYPGSFEFDDFWSFGGTNEPCGSAKNSTPKKNSWYVWPLKMLKMIVSHHAILKCCEGFLGESSTYVGPDSYWSSFFEEIPKRMFQSLAFPLSFLVAFLMFLVAGGIQGGAGSDYSGAAHSSQPSDR